MGIELIWEDENGVELGRVGDPSSLLVKILPNNSEAEYRCLCFVDPYGDAVFNQLQLPVLIQEFERRISFASSPEAQSHVASSLALVKKALSEVHTYVRFLGD